MSLRPSSLAVRSVPLLLGWFLVNATGCGDFLPLSGVDEVPEAEEGYNAYLCACDCADTTTPVNPPRSFVTVGADDAAQLQNPLRTVLNGSSLHLGVDRDDDPTTIALRLQALGIPRGSEIVSAKLRFTAADDADDPSSLFIDALQVANASAFTTSTDLGNLGPLTGNSVLWQPGAWVEDDSGDAQTSSDLRALLQPIVDLAAYTPNSAVVFVIRGSGRRTAVSFEGSDQQGVVRTQAPELVLEFKQPEHSQDFLVCGDPADAEADCAGRVQTTVRALANACKLSTECTCTYKPANGGTDPKTFSDVCNDDCLLIPQPADCNPEGFRQATATADTEPVCLGHSPLGSSLYGRRSACEVDPTKSSVALRFVDDDGDSQTETSAARGRVEFVGDPCPGQSCAVGMTHRLHLNDVTIEGFFGDNTFVELSSVGESLPDGAASLDASGAGSFAFGSTVNSGRAHHNEEDDTRALVASNADPIGVGVGGWVPRGECSLEGNLVGTSNPRNVCAEGPELGEECASNADCGDCGGVACECRGLSNAFTMTANVRGTLVNQPPTAAAGAEQTVECNASGRATFLLDATASGDPDNDITSFGWFRGSRTGDLVGAQPKIVVEQALADGDTTYFFKAIDAFGQYDEDSTSVTVVDTTDPVISCNAPASITPPQAAVSFMATAEDVCDPDVAAVITDFFCYKVGKNRTISKLESCVVGFAGDTLTITDSGGIGAHIRWTVTAADDSGNDVSQTCEVVVVKK